MSLSRYWCANSSDYRSNHAQEYKALEYKIDNLILNKDLFY